MTELEILLEAMQKISDLAHKDKAAFYFAETGKTDERGESYAYVCGKIGAIADYALEKTGKGK